MIGTVFMALEPSVPVGVARRNARRDSRARAMATEPPAADRSRPPDANAVADQLTRVDRDRRRSRRGALISTRTSRCGTSQPSSTPSRVRSRSRRLWSFLRWYRSQVSHRWCGRATFANEPLPGLYPKSVIYQFATGDQQAVNPGTTTLIRAGNLADRTIYYRHDLAFAQDPTVPKNPHVFAGSPTHPNALFRSISRGAQDQIGVFLASGGTVIIHPEPAQFFEVPISSPLPEELNFIR